MDRFFNFWEEANSTKIIIFLALLSFALRVLVLTSTIEIAGDGPTRAAIAYRWYISPHIATSNFWLPGPMYLGGILNYIFHDPLISSRILNLVIGTLTVPFFYLVIRRIYGHYSALLSSSLLTFYPLHIGLSASSLAEPILLFGIITGIYFLLLAIDREKKRKVYLILFFLCVCLAEMARYEAWLFIPLFPLYYYYRIRKLNTAILMLFILVLFPLSWMIDGYFRYGDPLLIATATKATPHLTSLQGTNLYGALKNIAKIFWNDFGSAVLILVISGLMLNSYRILKREISMEQLFHLGIHCFYWPLMIYLAIPRGSAMPCRYFLFGLVMLLPLATVPILAYMKNSPRSLLPILFIIFASSVMLYPLRYPPPYVTKKQPAEIKKVSSWLKDSSYSHDPILMTKMGWEASYLPLYFPDINLNRRSYLIFSEWTRRFELIDYLKQRRPGLLITQKGEEEYISAIESAFGGKITPDMIVHKEGKIKIYDIRSLTNDQ